MPVGNLDIEDMDNSIKAFSRAQWNCMAEDCQHQCFSKHTVYVYVESEQKLLPNVRKFDALSLACWFDLSAKRCVHGECLYSNVDIADRLTVDRFFSQSL